MKPIETPAANDDTVHTEAHKQLFHLAFRAATEVDRVIRKHMDNIVQWLQVQYGDTPPTYEQFWDDRDALKAMAKERGLKDDQSIRKPYNAAVKHLYGDQIMASTAGRSALPVSTTKEAVAKRMIRPAPVPRTTTKISAGTVIPWPKNAMDAVKLLLGHYGFPAILTAFSALLAEHKEMAREAKRIEEFAARSVQSGKPAKQKERRMAH